MDPPHEPSHYCIDGLVDFQNTFVKSHSLLSLFLTLSGAACNSLAIYVLTRQQMRSPIHLLFTSRAFVDLLVNTVYIPCVIGVFLPHLFATSNHAVKFVPVLDMISVWLTITIAVWVYIALIHPQRSRVLSSMPRTISIIVCACVVCPVLCIPMYRTYCVKGYATTEEDYGAGSDELGIVASYAPPADVADVDDKVLVEVIEWFYGVFLKIVPCAIVGVVTLEIWTKQVKATTKHHGSLTYIKVGTNMETIHQSNTSKNTLLVFFIVFVFYELTEGIVNLSSFILGETFAYKSHTFLFEVLDLLNQLNRNVVFIVFCATSVQFRTIAMFIVTKPRISSCFRRFSNDPETQTTSSFKSS